jgi:hypothetical protein
MAPRYATREQVKGALDIPETAPDDARVDRAIESASRAVEKLCRRRFHPTLATRYFDWPTWGWFTTPWRLALGADEIISVATLTSGGVTVDPADYRLEPANDGPPFSHIELELDQAAWLAAAYANGLARQVAVTGLFGGCNEFVKIADALGAIAADHGTLTFSDASMLGVGDTVRIDSEYIHLAGRGYADSTQNLAGGLTAQATNTTVPVPDGAGFAAGETILVDAEAMLIVTIAGDNLLVERGHDGTEVAAHTAGSDVYANRSFTVARGQLGSTAAIHVDGADAFRLVPPALVTDLTIAEALTRLQNEAAGYARTAGFGEAATEETSGRQLAALRDDCRAAHGRLARAVAV